MMGKLSFLTESANDFKETRSIGTFQLGDSENSFSAVFESVHDNLMSKSINPKIDINKMIHSSAIMNTYKDGLLEGLRNDAANDESGHVRAICEQVEQLWENCKEDFIQESTRVGNLLPYKAVDFPILVKQHVKSAAKDIMQTEVVDSPLIKKHFEKTWVVDYRTGNRWEYPKCFFNDEYKEIFKAGKGLPIQNTPVAVPMFQKDIITELTDGGNPARDRITSNLKIVKAIGTDGKEYPMNMYINMSTRQWQGGEVKVKNEDGKVELKDNLTGAVDFTSGLVSVSTSSGFIASVVFDGYLSNELNERYVGFDYSREELQFAIEDGFRMDVPYSLEELEDAKALLNLDLYKKTYDNLGEIQTQMEDSGVLDYLDTEFEKWKAVTDIDTLEMVPFVKEAQFDCDHTKVAGVIQAEYIDKMLKFTIDRLLVDIADDAKLEDITFVIYGNPRYISLLGGNVTWVLRAGDTLGGIKLNYSYGVMTTGNVKVTVVSTNKINAKTHKGLRIVPFPLNPEQFTHKHYKYSSHILTTQNSGYKAADRPGGSMTNLMAVNRNTTVSIQGIQADLGFKNIDFINVYGQ